MLHPYAEEKQMTEKERKQIIEMRAAGLGYARIAGVLDMSINSVKSYCRRHRPTASSSVPDRPEETHAEEAISSPPPSQATSCEQCGCQVLQTAGRKHRRFCSDACRQAWWASHRGEVNQKAMRHFVCENCGMQFSRYGVSDRRFCSRSCAAVARKRKEADHDA